MAVPLYSYDLAFQGVIPERRVVKLERAGLAKVVRHKKGHIARIVMYRRPNEPLPTTVRDYLGKGYSFKHHLEDGHRPWALKPLTGRVHKCDQNVEYHLAPESLRPIFIRVLLDCLMRAQG